MSVGDFEILKKLGEGAYSNVYKVQRKSDAQIYALKKVRLNPLKQKEKQNALTEVRILASIFHDNIVAYKESFVDEDTSTLCIVMEFAAGGDLLSKVNLHKKNRTRFTESQIWRIFSEAAQGLKALHDMKIMHRDIKSANIFLDESGKVKIGDLNVAKVAKAGLVYTQTGTPYYASPEVWKDQPYDAKSDIWSLGCVIYELATLFPPFRAQDMKGLFRKVTRADFQPLPSSFSAELNDLIKQMLSLTPSLRPSLDRVLSSPSIKRNSGCSIVSEAEGSLLNTIHMPNRLNALGGRLPAPNYRRKSDIESRDKTKFFTPKAQRPSDSRFPKMASPSVDFRRPANPSKLRLDSKRPDVEIAGMRRANSINPDTIAAKIKELKGQYINNPVMHSRKHSETPAGKPIW